MNQIKVGFGFRLKYSLPKKGNSKVITIGLGFILISILGINTIRKTHICDHEPPIPNNQLIQLNDDIIGRLVDSLRFKTVSTEGEIDYKPYKKFWDFILDQYPMIFNNKKFKLKWIQNYTLIISTHGTDSSLKPGLFVSHMDVVPAIPGEWNSDPFEPKLDGEYIQVHF